MKNLAWEAVYENLPRVRYVNMYEMDSLRTTELVLRAPSSPLHRPCWS